MKKILVSIVIALTLLSTVLSQQVRKTVMGSQSKSPSKTTQKSVVRNQDLEVLTASKNGTIFVGGYLVTEMDDHFVNYALLWRIADSKVTLQKAPVFPRHSFWLNDHTGWISGPGEGVYKTIDGGGNWEKQSYSDEIRGNVFFLDERRGWYFADGSVLKQIEDEKTRELTSFDNFPHRKKLQFVNDDIGWLLDVFVTNPNPIKSQARFQKSQDGGKSWKVVEALPNEVADFQFLNASNGYAATARGLYSTADGGFSWDLVLMNPHSEAIDNIFFLSSSVGWTLGTRICMTQNAGLDWTCKKRPSVLKGFPIKGFIFTSEYDGWLLIDNKLFFTTDGGKIWKRKTLSFNNVKF